MVTGRRQYGPLVVFKRIDSASPLLEKALVNNETIEAAFKFFRPSPNGDGTTEQFYTVTIKDGHISAMKQLVNKTIDPATAGEPPLEQVSFVFKTINWTYTKGGITHEDSWEANK
jgi:type VI secretion system secreted protein Hcp